jgi:ubiquinone/menaquinone biosynthesis C-methylase UbiE
MAHRICPWWLGYLLASPIRRLWHDPHSIVEPFVTAGSLVLEPGCGMGFFTLEMARLAGPAGRIVAVDVQEKMIAGLQRRARRAGVIDRIETRLAGPGGLGVDDLSGKVDFALAFAVIHEFPDVPHFFSEAFRALRTGGRILVAEPKGHVQPDEFRGMMQCATRAGFLVQDGPDISRSRTALLVRS